MYERFYQLRERPFALSPDPDYLYPSRGHREALDYLRFGIQGDAGFVVITGEIGSGKTTLLQYLLRSLEGRTTVVRLVNTLLTGRELLESILIDLGVPDPPPTKPLLLRELASRLVELRSAGRRVVAVIDEAQNLPFDALEELRMLSNLETEKSKLIQIVMVGQPNLRDSLDQPSLEQLRQRVTVRYHIGPLDAAETAQYINHRLARAAVGAPLTFPPDVTAAIYNRSGGVPRMTNVICDAVLLCGYAEEQRIVDTALVTIALEELSEAGIIRPPGAPPALPAGEPWQRVATAPASATKPLPVKPAPVKPIEPIAPRPERHASAADDMVMRPSVAGLPSLVEIPMRGVEHRAATAAPPSHPFKVANSGAPRPPVSPRPARTAADPGATAPAMFRASGISPAPSRPAPPSVAGTSEVAAESSAWSWLRQVLFGSAHEAGRR